MATHTITTFGFGNKSSKKDIETIFKYLKDNDVVDIRASNVTLEQGYCFTNKKIIIKGRGINKTTIHLGNGKERLTSFLLSGQFEIMFKDCTIELNRYTTFLQNLDDNSQGVVRLVNVNVKYKYRPHIDNIVPAIYLRPQQPTLEEQRQAQAKVLNVDVAIANSELPYTLIDCASVKMIDSAFVSPAFSPSTKITAVTIEGQKLVLGNAGLSCLSRNYAVLQDVTILYRVNLSGLLTLQNVTFRPYPLLANIGFGKADFEAFVGKELSPYKADYPPVIDGLRYTLPILQVLADYDYFPTDVVVQGFEFDLSPYEESGMSFSHLKERFDFTFFPITVYTPDEDKKPNAIPTKFSLRDGEIPKIPFAQNRIYTSEMMFESVQDHSDWEGRDYDFSMVRSTSSLPVGNYLFMQEVAYEGNNESELVEEVEEAPTQAPQVADHEMSALDELDSLTGLTNAKKLIHQMVSVAVMNKQRERLGMKVSRGSLHTVFLGEAGTGKTTVARLYGRALFENGVLPTDKFKEVSRKDLVANYVGQTAKQVAEVCQDALGGILFVDEAYSLQPSEQGVDFAKEAIDELIMQMENHRDDLIVILAGYTKEMEHFINTANTGLKSRFTSRVVFDSYSDAELIAIFHQILGKNQTFPESPEVERLADEGLIKAYRTAYELNPNATGNARYVRNFVEAICQMRDTRISRDYLIQDLDVTILSMYKAEDVENAIEKMFEMMRSLS